MPGPIAANNATALKLALLAFLLTVWLVGRYGTPEEPRLLTGDDLVIEPKIGPPIIKPVTVSESSSSPDPSQPVIDPKQPGHIRGIVRFVGDIKPRKAVEGMSTDPYCMKWYEGKPALLSERWVIADDGGIQNVLVHVTKGVPARKWTPPTMPAVIDQEGCVFRPHITTVLAGQPIEVRNLDATLHNVHIIPQVNREFSYGQPARGMVEHLQLTRPEIGVFVKCDVHAWMSAYVHVMSHPYFDVSDAAGTYEIRDLPPGEYELSAWHEVKAFQADGAPLKVKVEPGKVTTLEITLRPKVNSEK